ncbi:MAG: DUF1572 family protein [Rhodothermales bacterium]
MIQDALLEFKRYKATAENAMAQVSDAALDVVPAPDGNSIAMIVRHMSGNLRSRFTDFLTSDGEKPWRRRDEEFHDRPFPDRAAMMAYWEEGWEVVWREVGALTDADADRTVTIRAQPLTVRAALLRAVAHVAYHVGQIILLARIQQGTQWDWISIPKGQSETYNLNPTRERSPDPPR